MLPNPTMISNPPVKANDLVQAYCDQSPASRLALTGNNTITTQKLPKVSTESLRQLEVEYKCSPVQVIDFKVATKK